MHTTLVNNSSKSQSAQIDFSFKELPYSELYKVYGGGLGKFAQFGLPVYRKVVVVGSYCRGRGHLHKTGHDSTSSGANLLEVTCVSPYIGVHTCQ